MNIRINLNNFRCYQHVELDFVPGINVVYGPNGIGKTSAIEAISMITPGRGIRRAKMQDLHRANQCEQWWVTMNINQLRISVSSIRHKKVINCNENKISSKALLRDIGALWLTPQMVFDFWNTPQARRNILDRICMNHIPDHGSHIMLYDRFRSLRKNLIDSHQNINPSCRVHDDAIIEYGNQIIKNRNSMIQKINEVALQYSPYKFTINTSEHFDKHDETMVEWPNNLKNEINFRGPHNTDIVIWYNKISAKQASTGEQVSILLQLIIYAFQIMIQDTKILLLDDVLSHLDLFNKKLITDILNKIKGYIIITDINSIDNSNKIVNIVDLYKIINGES